MEYTILKISGEVAGIGGLAIGAIVLLYKDVIARNIFPRLTREQAYSLLKMVVVLSWSIAVAGIGAWAYVGENNPERGNILSPVTTTITDEAGVVNEKSEKIPESISHTGTPAITQTSSGVKSPNIVSNGGVTINFGSDTESTAKKEENKNE